MPRKSVSMTRWRCPKCKSEIEAIAKTVTHKCPSNKSQITAWEAVNND